MIAAGPFVNIALALVLFFVLAVGFGLDTGPTNRVGTVSEDLPAAKVLQPGDKLVSVDGKRVGELPPERLADAVRGQVGTHECARHPTDGCVATSAAAMKVIRDGEPVSVRVKPVYDAPETPPGQPDVAPRMVVGFGYEANARRSRRARPPASRSTGSGT